MEDESIRSSEIESEESIAQEESLGTLQQEDFCQDDQEEGEGLDFESLDEDELDDGEEETGEGIQIRPEGPSQDEQLQKAIASYTALKTWRSFISCYSKNFRFMDKVNRLPQGYMLSFMEGLSEKNREQILLAKLGLLGTINDLSLLKKGLLQSSQSSHCHRISSLYSSLSETSLKRSKKGKISNSKIDTRAIFELLEQDLEARKPFWKQESDSWFSKTTLEYSENDQKIMKQLKKFSQPPFDVTNNMMYEAKRKMDKLTRKNGVYRVLGKRASSTEQQNDPEIFEERDTANDLLHELMSASLTFGEDLAKGEQGLTSSTARLIQQRQLMRKKKNSIDNRASKDRKLRYVFHDKLINFMNSYDNLQEVQQRDQLVGNLFGVSKNVEETDSSNGGSGDESDDGEDVTLLQQSKQFFKLVAMTLSNF